MRLEQSSGNPDPGMLSNLSPKNCTYLAFIECHFSHLLAADADSDCGRGWGCDCDNRDACEYGEG